ncbi:MAG: hypothetical protein M3355_11865 [Actinomycetota bacterium]|nr:hypothetical protein [Actinomycetota bacterium]
MTRSPEQVAADLRRLADLQADQVDGEQALRGADTITMLAEALRDVEQWALLAPDDPVPDYGALLDRARAALTEQEDGA